MQIGFDQVKFLGHTSQGDCIKPQDESVGQILNTERPKTKKSCRSLLGMIHLYRRYIPNCAEVIAPLMELTKTDLQTMLSGIQNRKGHLKRSRKYCHLNQF